MVVDTFFSSLSLVLVFDFSFFPETIQVCSSGSDDAKVTSEFEEMAKAICTRS